MNKSELLRHIPSVDRILKNEEIQQLLNKHPHPVVLECVRAVLDRWRDNILNESITVIDKKKIVGEIKETINRNKKYSLTSVINATGVVIHTNLGRAILAEEAIKHVVETATSYSNLEYDLEKGQRGKRYSHIVNAIKKVVDVPSAVVVNNNAAAVFICLNSLARGKEVIVSRGELVEIGGSFRIPDVMAQSGAVLKEVGTTNKTRISDYASAINENTALLLKVHKSNFKITGFTEEVSVSNLVTLGREKEIPVMVDLGSGSFIDLKKYGFHDEPSVQDILSEGADIVTFSGDKLLGSAQAGFILGKSEFIEVISKNPLMRALRVDKMTLAAVEATLRLYLDERKAIEQIPTLRMILEDTESIKKRATTLCKRLKKEGIYAYTKEDISMPGGGSLPESGVKTYVVAVKPNQVPQEFTKKLRQAEPPVIARIKDDLVIFDARTIQEKEIPLIVRAVKQSLTI
ncbi:MAG TPA: L-seryl-tRNA(Sec) selenium transferase [Thermodesulfovibrio thiophilus]|uniref:L-seryl-tRNA(Sec) selenium transferase n=1 Tax=Thermodesulfovibrio thiophilus TaxID=340095 RepID=UPI00184E447C|nr:L-seryl-tRNA(Sec) selenium transferase [Thermodesulfovibrio thiophilus]HHW20121.1 L-seryl-tRNA(Sec) selenium transferase [Thermodesulfovibrio thiophilus]HQA03876.1 L-seryl-tRNA(Sec) selenium transferase [Thermodesulfovibrio thiophilus]HQD35958.1 L-seryl-tRNA(Sec) selenium transferase [Thermodesulfovibrio thiophilus]